MQAYSMIAVKSIRLYITPASELILPVDFEIENVKLFWDKFGIPSPLPVSLTNSEFPAFKEIYI